MEKERMTSEKYEENCRIWNEYYQVKTNYLNKRAELSKLSSSKTLIEDLYSLLKITYWENANFEFDYFGPTTEIWSPEDLKDEKFILPGIGKSYNNLKLDRNLPDSFGKFIYNDDIRGKNYCLGKIVGFSYDNSDFYIIVEKDNIIDVIDMNSRYRIGN